MHGKGMNVLTGHYQSAPRRQSQPFIAGAHPAPHPHPNDHSHPNADDDGGSGLSSGAKIGIAIGVVLVVFILSIAVFVACRRRMGRRANGRFVQMESPTGGAFYGGAQNDFYPGTGYPAQQELQMGGGFPAGQAAPPMSRVEAGLAGAGPPAAEPLSGKPSTDGAEAPQPKDPFDDLTKRH